MITVLSGVGAPPLHAPVTPARANHVPAATWPQPPLLPVVTAVSKMRAMRGAAAIDREVDVGWLTMKLSSLSSNTARKKTNHKEHDGNPALGILALRICRQATFPLYFRREANERPLHGGTRANRAALLGLEPALACHEL